MTAPAPPPGLEPLHAAYVQQVGLVRAAIQLYGLPAALLEEIVLETFVLAHGRGEDLRDPAQARAKLCVLALRVADGFRDEVPEDQPPVTYAVPGGNVLGHFLDMLGERRREMFVLAEVGALRVPEISAELGLGFDAVRGALVDLVRDFTAVTVSAGAEEVLHLWIAACQPDAAALQLGWHRVATRIAPQAVEAAPAPVVAWARPPISAALPAAAPVLSASPPAPAWGLLASLDGPDAPLVASPAPQGHATAEAPAVASPTSPVTGSVGAAPAGATLITGLGPPRSGTPTPGPGSLTAPAMGGVVTGSVGGAPVAGATLVTGLGAPRPGTPTPVPGSLGVPITGSVGGAPAAGATLVTGLGAPPQLGLPPPPRLGGPPGLPPPPRLGGAPVLGLPPPPRLGTPSPVPGAVPSPPLLGAPPPVLGGMSGGPDASAQAAPGVQSGGPGSIAAPSVGIGLPPVQSGAGAPVAPSFGALAPAPGDVASGAAQGVAPALGAEVGSQGAAPSHVPGSLHSPESVGQVTAPVSGDMSAEPGAAQQLSPVAVAPLGALPFGQPAGPVLGDMSAGPGSGQPFAAQQASPGPFGAPAQPGAFGQSMGPVPGDMSVGPGLAQQFGAPGQPGGFGQPGGPVPGDMSSGPGPGQQFGAPGQPQSFQQPGPGDLSGGSGQPFGAPPLSGPFAPAPGDMSGGPGLAPAFAAPLGPAPGEAAPPPWPVVQPGPVPGDMSSGPGSFPTPAVAGPHGSPMAPASAGPMGAPQQLALPPRPLHTFTDEGPDQSFASRPDHALGRRTSPWLYIAPVVLLLGAAGVWWFLGRDAAVERDDVAIAETPGAAATTPGGPPDTALTADTAGGTAGQGTAGTAGPAGPAGTVATPGDTTAGGPAIPGVNPPIPTSPTGDTPTVPVPTTPKVGNPKPKPKPKPTTPKPTTPKPTTPKPDPLETRRDQAEKADPGRVIMELEMLSAAKKGLKTNPNQSLAYIAQHNKEFPTSQLTDQFDEVRIKALCALNRSAEARAEAAAILKKRPTSRVAAAVKECKP